MEIKFLKGWIFQAMCYTGTFRKQTERLQNVEPKVENPKILNYIAQKTRVPCANMNPLPPSHAVRKQKKLS